MTETPPKESAASLFVFVLYAAGALALLVLVLLFGCTGPSFAAHTCELAFHRDTTGNVQHCSCTCADNAQRCPASVMECWP